MWIIIKLFITAIASVVRFSGKHFQRHGKFDQEFDGVRYCVKDYRNKRTSTGTAVKIPFECGSVFKITEESGLDRLFKSLGLAEEFQTGDIEFDKRFYIASDCSEFCTEIKIDPDTRKIISNLYLYGCKYIFCDGYTLTVKFSGTFFSEKKQAVAATCIQLFKQISNLGHIKPKFLSDRFQAKVLIIEAIIWSIAAYAFSGFLEIMLTEEDLYLFRHQVINRGLIFGAVMAAMLMTIIFLFLRGSSRGHRILIESFIVLCISLPVSGINLASDLNIELDKSEPTIIQGQVIRVYEEVTGTSKRRRHNYYLEFTPEENDIFMSKPTTLKIDHDRFKKFYGAQNIELKIGQGYLKFPWIIAINRTNF